jgi:hypothetical protein
MFATRSKVAMPSRPPRDLRDLDDIEIDSEAATPDVWRTLTLVQ